MNRDIEKLLAAVKGGKLKPEEMQDIGKMLLNSLSPEQEALLRRVTENRDSTEAFMNSPEVQKIIKDQ